MKPVDKNVGLRVMKPWVFRETGTPRVADEIDISWFVRETYLLILGTVHVHET